MKHTSMIRCPHCKEWFDNPKNLSLEDYFWSLIDKKECWIWMGTRSAGGYGTVRGHGDKTIYAHRYSYELHKGAIPKNMHVCHTCDNPSCANPDHLFLGTMSENIQDMISKQRHAHGEQSGNAILTEKDVLEIRSLYPTLNYEELSKKYGVNYVTIADAITRKTWKHIGGTPEKYPPRPKSKRKLKFTQEQVDSIRLEYSSGQVGYSKLAKKYGVVKSTIRDIIMKRSAYYLG